MQITQVLPLHRILYRKGLLFSLLFILLGCQGEETQPEKISVAFSCEQVGIMVDAAADEPGVYALINDFKIKLAEWSDCDVLTKEDWPPFLPDSTLAAVQSETYLLWAERHFDGLNFWTLNRAGSASATPSHIASWQNGQLQLLRPLDAADLAGYYTHASVDTSYVLFLGMDGGRLVSKLFASTETLPADKMLQRALPSFAATEELPLSYDLNTLDFQGPLGNGKVHWRKDSVALHFSEFMGQLRELDFVLVK